MFHKEGYKIILASFFLTTLIVILAEQITNSFLRNGIQINYHTLLDIAQRTEHRATSMNYFTSSSVNYAVPNFYSQPPPPGTESDGEYYIAYEHRESSPFDTDNENNDLDSIDPFEHADFEHYSDHSDNEQLNQE